MLKLDRKPANARRITFTFNGTKYTAKTNAKGVATVTVRSSVLKKLTVSKTIKTSAKYEGMSVSKSAKVRK